MPTLAEDILRLTGVDVRRCGACEDCSARFSFRDALDLSPGELLRRVLADDRAAVFHSRSLWLLSGCPARRVVCEGPERVDFAAVLAALRKLALESGVLPSEPVVAHLMQAFADQVHTLGRAHLRALVKEMRLRAKAPVTEPAQELAMLFKGKLRLFPSKVRDIDGVRKALEAERAGETPP